VLSQNQWGSMKAAHTRNSRTFRNARCRIVFMAALILCFGLLACNKDSNHKSDTAAAGQSSLEHGTNIQTCEQLLNDWRTLDPAVAWETAEKLNRTEKNTTGGLDCVAVELGIQLHPAEELQRLGIPTQPDLMTIINDKMFGDNLSPSQREKRDLIDRKLRDNMLTIDSKPHHNGNGGWIPQITVHNNNSIMPLERIYLEFQVYDEKNNLVWDGNMLIPTLKAGSSYTSDAAYNPAHRFIPDSVQSEVVITKKEFKW